MRLYLDTEFNGHGGELISMALVSQNIGWYAVKETECQIDPWVKENVIPKLDRKPLHADDFRNSFLVFMRTVDNPEIICDFCSDAKHFAQMLEGPDYPSSLDFAYRMVVLKTPPGQPVSENPHNALADAQALMRWHQSQE